MATDYYARTYNVGDLVCYIQVNIQQQSHGQELIIKKVGNSLPKIFLAKRNDSGIDQYHHYLLPNEKIKDLTWITVS